MILPILLVLWLITEFACERVSRAAGKDRSRFSHDL